MALNLRPRWVIDGGLSLVGDPALFRGTLIFGATDGNCRCIRLSDGGEVWRFPTVGMMRTDVIVSGGLAYFKASFQTGTGDAFRVHTMVYAVDAVTGLQRWRRQLDERDDQPSLLLHGGRLLVPTTDGRREPSRPASIVELDIAGTVLRSTALTGRPDLLPAGPQACLVINYATGLVQTFSLIDQTFVTLFTFARGLDDYAIFGRRLYAALRPVTSGGATEVLAIDMDRWEVQWSVPLSRECVELSAGEEGVVIAWEPTSPRGMTFALHDAASGSLRWSHTEGDHAGEGLFTRGLFITQTMPRFEVPHDQRLTITLGFDAATGQLKFRTAHKWTGSWIIDGGEVVVSSHGDFVLGLDVDRFWTLDLPGAVRGTPAVTGDRVLVGNADGSFGAFALDGGAVRWSTELPAPIEASPVVSGAVVFAGHRGGVAALDTATGQTLWRADTPQPVTSTLTVCGSLVVFGCRDRLIRAVQAANGALGWSFATEGFVEGGAAFDGANIYVGSDDGRLYAFRLDGTPLWRHAGIGEIKSTPLLAADLVIFGNAQGTLTALETATGTVRWQRQMPGGFTTNSATLHAEHFWISDEAGHVHRIAVADGEIEWTTQQPLGPLRNKVAWSGRSLFVASLSGSLFILDIWTGAVLREVRAGAPIFASPVALPEAVIVVTQEGQLQALVP